MSINACFRRHNTNQEASVSYVNTPVADSHISGNKENIYEVLSGKHDVKSDYETLNDNGARC